MRMANRQRAERTWLAAISSTVLLIFALGLAGCIAGTSGGGGGNPPPPVTGATISFCNNADPACTPETSFAVASLRDLVINVNWENVPAGNHTQMLEILQPGGGLYQSNQTSFLVADAAQGTMTMKRNLPVAGAWIGQRRITGEWSVRVSLDGNAIASQPVEINP